MSHKIDLTELNLNFYKYDDNKNQFIIENKKISTYYLSKEQVQIYNYFIEKNIKVEMDKHFTIKIEE